MSAPERRRERKMVTVLFADLVGFTARAEELDPEDIDEILAPYHARLRADLERFGGTVEKFIGDAVMAVFGAPHAHEDDAERAVRAALAIRDWALDQDGLELRIAVNTGEALVNVGARPQEGEPMVTGDVVNTAARMQTAAPVNGVLVGETTRRATDGVVEYREVDPIEAKGKSAPVRVWEALAARSRFGVDIVHGGAPLVGRDAELRLLVDALVRARDAGQPQLVTVVGVPGIGKSRLVYELMQVAAAAPELTRWRQGRCLPYGEGVTFWALGEIVKSQAGIFETDDAERAEEKLMGMLDELVAEDVERGWLAGHLRPLIGVTSDRAAVEDTEAEASAAWVRFFELLADETPLVLVIEDLHWADDRLLDFVDELVERATDAGILVVATARPELLERRPAWGGGKPNAVTLSLAPLADDDVARLVAALLEQSVLPAGEQQALLARAGGNPLFAEQYVRMLAEHQDVDELPLPETVQGIIAARLDALAPEEKALLQGASVHGKVFWVGAVAAMSDGAQLDAPLRSLERKEFLRRQRRSSVAGETEYTFRHVLLRDIAYGQIPRAERAERHRKAAEWIESLGEGRDDHVELLADHYLRALELARAARREPPELERRAALALRDAGARAVALNAFTAAVRFVERALELFADDDPERPHAVAVRAKALYFVGAENAIQLLEEASAALVDAREIEAAAEVEALLAEACWYRGDGRVLDHLERAQALVADAPVSAAKARVATRVARYTGLGGDWAGALGIAEEALVLAEEVGDADLQAHALNTIGLSRGYRGEFDTALTALERALELSFAANSPQAAAIYNNLATVLQSMGEGARGLEASREADRILSRYEDRQQARFRRMNAAVNDYLHGNWDDALAACDAIIAECAAGSPHRAEPAARSARAEIRSSRGDDAGAIEDLERALALARVVKDPHVVIVALAEGISVYLRAGRHDEALALARELLEPPYRDAARAHGAALIRLPLVASDLGLEDDIAVFLREAPDVLFAEAGRAVIAREWERGAALLEESFALPVALARLAGAKDSAARGRPAEANELLRKALPLLQKMRATRLLREAEELLTASAAS